MWFRSLTARRTALRAASAGGASRRFQRAALRAAPTPPKPTPVPRKAVCQLLLSSLQWQGHLKRQAAGGSFGTTLKQPCPKMMDTRRIALALRSTHPFKFMNHSKLYGVTFPELYRQPSPSHKLDKSDSRVHSIEVNFERGRPPEGGAKRKESSPGGQSNLLCH